MLLVGQRHGVLLVGPESTGRDRKTTPGRAAHRRTARSDRHPHAGAARQEERALGGAARPDLRSGDHLRRRGLRAAEGDLVGAAVARDLCFTGRSVDAPETLRMGLVSRVVAPDELSSVVAEVAAQIARVPRELLIRTNTKALRRAEMSVGATLDL
ncbi:MAG: hypothetical protein FJW88_03270 [Actinobacteria bacterium]|nr:hypothetical protein [Actinomycetota bacterium]